MTHRASLTGDYITQQVQSLILTTAPSRTRHSTHQIGSGPDSAVHQNNRARKGMRHMSTLEQDITAAILNSKKPTDGQSRRAGSHSKHGKKANNLSHEPCNNSHELPKSTYSQQITASPRDIPPLPRHTQASQSMRTQPTPLIHKLSANPVYPGSSLLSSCEVSLVETQDVRDSTKAMQEQIEMLQEEIRQLRANNIAPEPEVASTAAETQAETQSRETIMLEVLPFVDPFPAPMPCLDGNPFTLADVDLLGEYCASDSIIKGDAEHGLPSAIVENPPISMPSLKKLNDSVDLIVSQVKESSTLEDPINSPQSIEVLSNVTPKNVNNNLYKDASISISMSNTVSPTISIASDITFSEEQMREEIAQKSTHLSRLISTMGVGQQKPPDLIANPSDLPATSVSISRSAHDTAPLSTTASPVVTLTENSTRTVTPISSVLSPTLTATMDHSMLGRVRQGEDVISPLISTAITSIRKLLPSAPEPFAIARRIERSDTQPSEQTHTIRVPAYGLQHISKQSSEVVAIVTNAVTEEHVSMHSQNDCPTSDPILKLERHAHSTISSQLPDPSKSVIAVKSSRDSIKTRINTSLARSLSAQPTLDRTHHLPDTSNIPLAASRMAAVRLFDGATPDVRAQSAQPVRRHLYQTSYSSHLPMKYVFLDPSSSATSGTTAPIMRSIALASSFGPKEVPRDYSSLFHTTRSRLREPNSDFAASLLPITSTSLSPKTVSSYSASRKRVEHGSDSLTHNMFATYVEENCAQSRSCQKSCDEGPKELPIVQSSMRKPTQADSTVPTAISVTKKAQISKKQSPASIWTHTRVSSQILPDTYLKNCPTAPELSSFELHKDVSSEHAASSTDLSFNDALQAKRPPLSRQVSYKQSSSILNSFVKEPAKHSSLAADLTESLTSTVTSITTHPVSRIPLPRNASTTKQPPDTFHDYQISTLQAMKSPISPFDHSADDHLSAGSRANEMSTGIERVSSKILRNSSMNPEIVEEDSLRGALVMGDNQETSYTLKSPLLNDPTIRRQYTPSFSVNGSYCSSVDADYYSNRGVNDQITDMVLHNKVPGTGSSVCASETPDPNHDTLTDYVLDAGPHYQQGLPTASSDLVGNLETQEDNGGDIPHLTMSSLDVYTAQQRSTSSKETHELSPAPCYFTEPEKSITIEPASPVPVFISPEEEYVGKEQSGSKVTLSGLGSMMSPFPSLDSLRSPKVLAHTKRIQHTMEVLNELQAELSPTTQMSTTLSSEKSQADNTAEGSLIDSISLNMSTTPIIKKMQQHLLGAKTLISFVDIGHNQGDVQSPTQDILASIPTNDHEDVAIIVTQGNKFMHNPHVQGRKSTGYEFYSSIEQGSAILPTNRMPYSSSTSMFKLDGCSIDFNYRPSLDRQMLLEHSHLPSATPSLMYGCANDASVSYNRLETSGRYTYSGVNFTESSYISGIEAYLIGLQLNAGPLEPPCDVLSESNEECGTSDKVSAYSPHLHMKVGKASSSATHSYVSPACHKIDVEDFNRLSTSTGKTEAKKSHYKEHLTLIRNGTRSAEPSIRDSALYSHAKLLEHTNRATPETKKPRQLTAIHNPRGADINAALSEVSESKHVQELTDSHDETSSINSVEDGADYDAECTQSTTQEDSYLSESIDSSTIMHDDEIIDKICDLECEKDTYNTLTKEKCKHAHHQHSVYLSAMSLLTDPSACSVIDYISHEASIAETAYDVVRYIDANQVVSPSVDSNRDPLSYLHIHEKSSPGAPINHTCADILHEIVAVKPSLLLSGVRLEGGENLMDVECGSPCQPELQATALPDNFSKNQINRGQSLEGVAYSMYYVSREAGQVANAVGTNNHVSGEGSETITSINTLALQNAISFLRDRWMMAEEDLMAQRLRSETYMAQRNLILDELKAKIVDKRRVSELESALSQMRFKDHTILVNNVEYYGEDVERPRRRGFCGSQFPRRKKQSNREGTKALPLLIKTRKNKTEANKKLTEGAGENVNPYIQGSDEPKDIAANKKAKPKTKSNLLTGLFKLKDKEASLSAETANSAGSSLPAIAGESVSHGLASTVEEVKTYQDACATINPADKLLRDIWGGGETTDQN